MKRLNQYSVKLVKEKGALYDLEDKVVRSPEDAVKIINKVLDLSSKPNEHFVIMTLNIKNEVAGIHTIHIGSLNTSIVHPRDVFQSAILNNAASIICFHNHPSGNTTPSREDIAITKRLKDCGDMLGIKVLDHAIIGDNSYCSLKENGDF